MLRAGDPVQKARSDACTERRKKGVYILSLRLETMLVIFVAAA